MPTTKFFNKKTGAWEVVGTSHASELSIIDLEGNGLDDTGNDQVRIN